MHPRDPAILGNMGLKDICIRYIMVNLKFSTAQKQVKYITKKILSITQL